MCPDSSPTLPLRHAAAPARPLSRAHDGLTSRASQALVTLTVLGGLWLGASHPVLATTASERVGTAPRVGQALPIPPMQRLASQTVTQTVAMGGHHKMAEDLQRMVHAKPRTATPEWARWMNNELFVRALVVASDNDPEMQRLRAEVLRLRGSIYQRYVSAPVLSVLLPIEGAFALAQRPDVVGISPDRMLASTWSVLFTQLVQRSLAFARETGCQGLPGKPERWQRSS